MEGPAEDIVGEQSSPMLDPVELTKTPTTQPSPTSSTTPHTPSPTPSATDQVSDNVAEEEEKARCDTLPPASPLTDHTQPKMGRGSLGAALTSLSSAGSVYVNQTLRKAQTYAVSECGGKSEQSLHTHTSFAAFCELWAWQGVAEVDLESWEHSFPPTRPFGH